jgi:hypothetical protein
MQYLRAYGAGTRVDDGLSGLRLSEAVLAIRRWAKTLAAAPAAPAQAEPGAPAADGDWIDCDLSSDDPPVDGDTLVYVRLRNGRVSNRPSAARVFGWGDSLGDHTIVAYRLAVAPAAPAEPIRMSSVARHKARSLMDDGYTIVGYALEKPGDRSVVMFDAAVRWLTDEQRHALMFVEDSTAAASTEPLNARLLEALKAVRRHIELSEHVEALGLDCDQGKLRELYAMRSPKTIVSAAIAAAEAQPKVAPLTEEQIIEFASLCVMNRRERKTVKQMLDEYRAERGIDAAGEKGGA